MTLAADGVVASDAPATQFEEFPVDQDVQEGL